MKLIKRFLPLIIILASFNVAYGQVELKLDFYKHFKYGHQKFTNGYFKNPQIEMDFLGNVFIAISTTDYYEFETDKDTGSLILLMKFDKDGNLKWKQKWKYTDLSFAAFTGLQADDNGGVWTKGPLNLAVEVKIDEKKYNTFPNARTSFHFDQNGNFDKMAPMHFACNSELIKGLDGNYYSIGNSGELSSFDTNGKAVLDYFKPFYNLNRPEFAISANGDRAFVTIDPSGSRNMFDTVYSWSSYAHTVICFDSSGKVKWHRLIKDVGWQNEAAHHRARYDKQGNLYVASNFSKNTPGKSGLFSGGYRAIIYKFDTKGALVGEFYDTTNIGNFKMSSEAWLYNDEQGRINAVIYTYNGYNEQHYPNINLTAEQSGKMLKVVFDSNFNATQYFLGPRVGVPGNSMPSNKFCMFHKTYSVDNKYRLPDNTEISLMSNEDMVFMVLDSIGRPASTHTLQEPNQLSVIPNPNHGDFKIKLFNDQFKELNIKIYNSNGQLILDETTTRNKAGEYTISLAKSSRISGCYFISVKTDTGVQYQEKIMVD